MSEWIASLFGWYRWWELLLMGRYHDGMMTGFYHHYEWFSTEQQAYDAGMSGSDPLFLVLPVWRRLDKSSTPAVTDKEDK